MNVVDVLTQRHAVILDVAEAALRRAHQPHYALTGTEVSRARLGSLLDLVVTSIRERDLVPVLDHAQKIADDRFDAGYDIAEVQCAFNVLEESIWTEVVGAVDADHLAEAIGMVGTVLGAGRDALARAYVSRASHRHVSSLDLHALFRGGT